MQTELRVAAAQCDTPTAGPNVFTDDAGNFWSGWRVGAALQRYHIFSGGLIDTHLTPPGGMGGRAASVQAQAYMLRPSAPMPTERVTKLSGRMLHRMRVASVLARDARVYHPCSG